MEQRNGRIDRKLQPNAEVFCHYFVYTAAHRRTASSQSWSGRPRRSRRSWAAWPRCSKAAWPTRSSTASATRRRRDSKRRSKATDLDADNRQVVEEELEAARERQEDLKADRAAPGPLKTSQEWHRPRRGPFPLGHLLRPGDDAAPSRLKPLPATTGTSPSTASSSPPSTSAREPIRPGPTRWTRSARPASAIRSPGNGAGTRRSGRSSSTTPARWTRTSSTCTWNTASCSAARPFTAQGFVHHDLSRACLAQTSDAIPRVILLGRLCLYGPGRPGCTRSWSRSRPAGPSRAAQERALAPTAARPRRRPSTCSKTALLPTGGRDVDPVIQDKLRERRRARHRGAAAAPEAARQGATPRRPGSLWPSGRSRKPRR